MRAWRPAAPPWRVWLFLLRRCGRLVLRVHVGPPVVLDDLEAGRVGDAHRARMRIAAAITRGLVPLRAASGPLPPDPTCPTPGTAASPGGIVPPDIP